MKKIVSNCALLLLVSCGLTSPVLFTGKDIQYERGFAIASRKGQDRILVVRGDNPIGISVPYAEDWSFESATARPIFGRSQTRELVVSILKGERKAAVKEDDHLKDVLVRVRKNIEPTGIPIQEARVELFGDHFILSFHTELPTEKKSLPQLHFWAMRQTPEGQIYEAHFSTSSQTRSEREELVVQICLILINEFLIIPQRR
jgi:hypothetical protein